jgi:hypothetical protein
MVCPYVFPICLQRKAGLGSIQKLQFFHSLGKLLVHSKHVNLVYVEHRTELVITDNFLLVIRILKAPKKFDQRLVHITTCRATHLA